MTPALPALRADGLSVEYSKHAVLSDLELEIPTGQITTLVGPNGSGKSTLLKHLPESNRSRQGR